VDSQTVINLKFNTLVFFTFPEHESKFESPPTRKRKKADKRLEDIWSRKTENSVMFIYVLNLIFIYSCL
jgi:hypothetical protein